VHTLRTWNPTVRPADGKPLLSVKSESRKQLDDQHLRPLETPPYLPQP
jgi:hypothetical protein